MTSHKLVSSVYGVLEGLMTEVLEKLEQLKEFVSENTFKEANHFYKYNKSRILDVYLEGRKLEREKILKKLGKLITD